MSGSVHGVRLGVDVGSVRIGVAVSDPDGILATPLITVARDRSTTDGGRDAPSDKRRASVRPAPGQGQAVHGGAGQRDPGPGQAVQGQPPTGRKPRHKGGKSVTQRQESTPAPSDMSQIAALVREYGAVEIIVGLPLNLAGLEGPAAASIRQYVEDLAKVVDPVPIRLIDERMSTVAATRRLSERGVRGRRQRAVVDQAAAVEILQGWLDARRRPGEPA